MKNFNQFILTLLAAGLFASCSLTEEPTSFVNRKSFYKNESQCIAALNSCYMPANAIYTANFMLVTEACTDIWYSSSTTVDACLDVTPAKPQYGKNVWTQGYKGVMYCNECVECISSADLADGVKMPLAAEARVMRAFYYYVLTCMFGDVPFYTTMVDTDQRLAPAAAAKSAACPEPRPMKSARSCTMTWSGTHCRGSPPRTGASAAPRRPSTTVRAMRWR